MKYEYSIFRCRGWIEMGDLLKDLNEFGASGWELVSVVSQLDGSLIHYFKRVKP
jgi:hypothetical protein